MPAPILHFEYSLFSKLSKPAAGVLARGSSFIAGQIAELSFGKGCRITTGIGGHIAAFNNPSKQLANGSSSLRCGASPLFIGCHETPNSDAGERCTQAFGCHPRKALSRIAKASR